MVGAVLVGGFWCAVAGGQTREFGLDVSQFQGTINWTQTAQATLFGQKISYVFIRSTRGGLTAAESSVTDTQFATNIVAARNQGLHVAPYHFSRPDLWSYSASTTANNSPEREAQHFMNVAGNYMVPGYLRPVLDLEAGDVNLTASQLTEWALRFCNAIAAAKGEFARPIIYLNTNYATNEVTSLLARSHPLWLARPDVAGQDPLNGDPVTPSGYSHPYGVWRSSPSTDPHPWGFWQYSWTGTIPGITANVVDLNVCQTERVPLSSYIIRQTIVPEPGYASGLIVPAVMLRRRRR